MIVGHVAQAHAGDFVEVDIVVLAVLCSLEDFVGHDEVFLPCQITGDLAHGAEVRLFVEFGFEEV